LLDELLDGRSLFEPPTAERLRQALDDHVQSLAPGDLERALEELRYFKEATLLRVGACELAGALPTAKVSDALTALAELLCERTLHLAWEETLARYGAPRDHAGQPGSNALCVLAYGKLGGFELGWGSDLDLVFLHDLPPTGQTVGPKVVSNVQFLNRVVQRFMHFLSHRSHSGVLYEIDLRLRPEGASGLLLTTFDAFERYQRERAWTFEHQALVRARPILGPALLQARFRAFRETILAMPRPEGALREAILAMRERIREAKGGALSPVAKGFALKQDRGGIVDIEFMVQYFVLAWSAEDSGLLAWTDVLRILAAAQASGRLQAPLASLLRDGYLALRAEGHRRALQGTDSRTDDPSVVALAQQVAEIWAGFAAEGGRYFGPKGP
jgi:glutamate-ammonia-ligase adenylyltransferase